MNFPLLVFILLASSLTFIPLGNAQEIIIYAGPATLGQADGSSPANALELQAAFDATRNPSGPITVILSDGFYRREYVVPSRDNDNSAPPLTIRAANPGRAIIDGSDTVTAWVGPDVNEVWETPWTEAWGPTSGGRVPAQTHQEKSIFFRRELVFVNDRPLEQVMASDGIAPAQAQTLTPGQFTVDDIGKVIRLRFPSGLTPRTSRVEISRRGARPPMTGQPAFKESSVLFTARGIANLTLDGFVIRRGAQAANNGMAISIGSKGINYATLERRVKNLVINECQFIENGAQSVIVSFIDGLTVRRSGFSRNGYGGCWGPIGSKNVLYEDCTFEDNNWRFGGWAATYGAAGIKLNDGSHADRGFPGRTENVTFRRCSFQRNNAGAVWLDWGPKNTLFENCLFADNSTAIQLEINSGPIIIRDSVIRGNGGGAILAVNTPDVTIERCVIVDALNGQQAKAVSGPWKGDSLIAVSGDTRNEGKPQYASLAKAANEAPADPNAYPPAEYYRCQRWTIRDSVVQSTSDDRNRLFSAHYWGKAAEIGFNPGTIFADTFTCQRNRFFQVSTLDAFILAAPNREGAGQFVLAYAPGTALTDIDPTSKWEPVSDAAIAALNPLDGRRIDVSLLPSATKAERLELLKRGLNQASRNLRISGQGVLLRLALRNPTEGDLRVSAELKTGQPWLLSSDLLTIPPGLVGMLNVNLKPESDAALADEKPVSFTLIATPTTSAPVTINAWVNILRPGTLIAGLTPVLDGKADEWAQVPAQVVGRPAHIFVGGDLLNNGKTIDAKATLQTATDGDHLYVAITVQDDTRSVTGVPLWEQDSLELFWDNRAPAERNGEHGPGTGQLIVAWPATDGPIPAKDWMKAQGKIHSEQIRSYAKRTADGWVLELAIPLAELGGQPHLSTGGSMALNLNFNDRDGEDANFATLKRLTLAGRGNGNASTADYLPFFVKFAH